MPFPWSTLVGLAGQAVSGIASAINNRRTQAVADAESARQQAYYQAKANENPLARSENQTLLRGYDRKAQQTAERARNTATILGQTPEQQLATQKQLIDGRADLMAGMSAGASARVERYNELAEKARHDKVLADQERRAARNQTYANLAANAASAAANIDIKEKGIADYQSELEALEKSMEAGSLDQGTYNAAKDRINSKISEYWQNKKY